MPRHASATRLCVDDDEIVEASRRRNLRAVAVLARVANATIKGLMLGVPVALYVVLAPEPRPNAEVTVRNRAVRRAAIRACNEGVEADAGDVEEPIVIDVPLSMLCAPRL